MNALLLILLSSLLEIVLWYHSLFLLKRAFYDLFSLLSKFSLLLYHLQHSRVFSPMASEDQCQHQHGSTTAADSGHGVVNPITNIGRFVTINPAAQLPIKLTESSNYLTWKAQHDLRFLRVNDLPLDEVNDVYLLDFVGPSGFIAEISTKVDSVTILDHHKTAFEALSGNVFIGKNVTKVIDMDRSGATIAFDFFKEKLSVRTNISKDLGIYPHGKVGYKLVSDSKYERVHKLFKYIEDADLWRWELPHSKAFTSGLKDMNIEYNVNINPTLFDQLLALDPEHVIGVGQKTLSHKQKLIDDVLQQSYKIGLGNGLFGQCLAVNADSVADLRSELGNQLAIKSRNLGLRGIGAVVYKVPELNNDQVLKISLRSIDSEDTTSISMEYGGGGHQKASSFMLNCTEFEKWKVETDSSISSG